MTLPFFGKQEISRVSEALDIAEDFTGNYFKLPVGQWARCRYDVRTLSSARGGARVVPFVFAVLNRGYDGRDGQSPRERTRDYYFICLQDHAILQAVRRDPDISLQALLIYVLTHELIHIVRFTSFHQQFEMSQMRRRREEAVVHALTQEVLHKTRWPSLQRVVDRYRHRWVEVLRTAG